ncbi:hypothetical protein HY734_00090 [Candidatus Uhrbacteria bacterium]|nr:hypothetical protein [Candidatus Uhrbacteria bacterium]
MRAQTERPSAVRSGLTALGVHRLLMHIGAGLLGLFLPIYLYGLFGGRVWMVLGYGALHYLLVGLFQP